MVSFAFKQNQQKYLKHVGIPYSLLFVFRLPKRHHRSPKRRQAEKAPQPRYGLKALDLFGVVDSEKAEDLEEKQTS